MNNQRRQRILYALDKWIDEWGIAEPNLFMDVQCELLNMQEEIDTWMRYVIKLKGELADCKNNKKPTTSISVL